jgi:hypothetical protein
MKTVKLGLAFALMLALIVGFCLPVQAGILDAQWYKARIEGQTRLFVTDATGEVEKIKLDGDFYFKLCSEEGVEVNACGGEEYVVAVAVADLNDNGEFGDIPQEVFAFFGEAVVEGFMLFYTCGLNETSFNSFLAIDNFDPDPLVNLVFTAETIGRVKDEGERIRANSGNGGTAAEIDDVDLVADGADGIFRKLSWRADAVAVEDLPEELIPNLILLDIIGDLLDLRCFSEIPAEAEPPAEPAAQ